MNKISAIIPTYNRESFIVSALESVLQQTRQVDEIIVVDDGSTDNTEVLLRKYQDRIKYIKQNNAGPAAARNTGLLSSSGEYIAFLDSDDTWVSDKIELQLDLFRHHPDVDIVFGCMANVPINKHSEVPKIEKKYAHRKMLIKSGFVSNIIDCLIYDNIIPTPTVVMKRCCVKKVGLFNEELMIAEDFEYWLRACLYCRFGYIDRILVIRGRHEGNLVNDWVKMNTMHLAVLKQWSCSNNEVIKRRQNLISKKTRAISYDLGSHFLGIFDFSKAYKYLQVGCPGMNRLPQWLVKFFMSFCLKRFVK